MKQEKGLLVHTKHFFEDGVVKCENASGGSFPHFAAFNIVALALRLVEIIVCHSPVPFVAVPAQCDKARCNSESCDKVYV